MASLLYLAPLLVALLAPGAAVLAGCRLRVVVAVVFVPLTLVVLAALISAPTGWGHAKAPASDDLTNTGGLVYLVFFTAVAQLAGIVIAVIAAVISRVVRPRVAGSS